MRNDLDLPVDTKEALLEVKGTSEHVCFKRMAMRQAMLASLEHVVHLTIHGQGMGDFEEVDLTRLKGLGRLRRLELIGPDLMVEPDGLASLPVGLTELVIENITVVNDGGQYESEALKHLGRLSSLRSLKLHGNDLDNHAADVLGRMPYLERMDIETTSLFIPALGIMTRLVDLRLPKYSYLKNDLFEALCNGPRGLRRLELRGATFVDEDYECSEDAVNALENGQMPLRSLVHLDLGGGCKMYDGEPMRFEASAMSALTSLTRLVLD